MLPDFTIPLILIVVAIVVIVASKMGVLPKKSLPFVAGALASVFGLSLFKKLQDKSRRSALQKREEELAALGTRAQATAAATSAADVQRTAALAELQRQKESVAKEELLIQARTDAEKDEISKLQGVELFERFVKTFPNR
jgi:hypothetical protein